MAETEVYVIVAKQKALADELTKLQTNVGKDGQSRKTRKYKAERLQKVEEIWLEFSANHEQIKNHLNPDTPYIALNTRENVHLIYCDLKATLHAIQPVDDSKNISPQNETAGTSDKSLIDQKGKTDVSGLKSQNTEFNIAGLIRRQQAAIEGLYRAIPNELNGKPKEFYQLKIKVIESHLHDIRQLHNQIYEYSEDPQANGYNDQQYYNVDEVAQEGLIRLYQASNTRSNLQDYHSSSLNLPNVALPKFDGDYMKWRQFHDLFVEMVHRKSMANCQKMYYLKTSLLGEAEKLIRHLAPTEENYEAAWKIINDRFENKRLLVTAILNKLMGQPAISIENAVNIKTIHDTTQECLLALKGLEIDISSWDPIILHVLIRKLDVNTHTLWEQSIKQPRLLQPLTDFLNFLELRFQSLEALGYKTKHRKLTSQRSVAITSTSYKNNSCKCCKGNHQLYTCHTFLQMTPVQRLALVKKISCCINCLRIGHTSSKCASRGCKICSSKHNSLLHLENESSIDKKDIAPATLAAEGMNKQGYIFLSTVIVDLVGQDGLSINCRAVLDSGSQINIITERMVRKLNMPFSFQPITIQGVGSSKKETTKRANVSLHSKTSNFETRLEAIILPQIISPQPTQTFNVSSWKIPKNIKLADPQFNKPNNIDLLIGAEFFHQLLCIGQIKLGNNLPLLQNTFLGWIVTGKINEGSEATQTCGILTEEMSLEDTISKFWQTEELPSSSSSRTLAEEKCEDHFNQSTSRNIVGSYIVSLPFADDSSKLGSSSDIALNRFKALERRLDRNPELKIQYKQFMSEYIRLGHMTEINFKAIPRSHYFLPHHCVLKPDSSTTKLRVVFDASAKTSSNVSLNDILYAGPTIQDDLFTILLRFRLPRFVIKADIQKMYRQILMREDDQYFQLIWWRFNQDEPIKCFKLNTVTYGTTSAPYLAIKCLQSLALEYSAKYPIGSQVLLHDFYVDDVMTGSNSIVEAKDMQAQLSALLREGGFELKKWCSNNQQLLENIPPENQEIPIIDSDGTIKTLGLKWRPKADTFCITAINRPMKKFTKRTVASEIAKIFDPLGLVAPVILVAKLFLQELWALNYDWDASLPEEMYTRWNTFYQGLNELNNFQIPRHVFANSVPSSIQIHTFADASEKAYGAVSYIRSVNKDGTIIVRLLCSKSRVAPNTKTSSGINSMTIPRLELCAAVLAAELSKRVKTNLNLDQASSFLWSDSQIVLSWIKSRADSFQTFVGRRISAIQRLTTPVQWRHVRSADNPADVLSRGIQPVKLLDHNLWKYGPRFLHGKETIWPPQQVENMDQQTERKDVALLASKDQHHNIFDGIKHFGSFNKLKRIVAYCVRFVNLIKSGQFKDVQSIIRSRSKLEGKSWPLTTCELEMSLQAIVKGIQVHGFQRDIQFLKMKKELHKESPLKGLAVFLDEDGLLRVGGRLQESKLPYDSKHPMLLPYSHPFVNMILTELHTENNHVGPQGLLALTRQRFWPIKGKNIARSITQHCTFCIKTKPKMYNQMMGNLPATRVQPARPFINTGVDFCGPLWVHYRTRGSRPQKCYLSIFCCFASKAVHIEVVSELTTDAFLGALRRFMSRRGHIQNLYCDNATNFVGARNQLEELNDNIYSTQAQAKITTLCSSKNINFHFIPPRAPHFGGLWEAAVKSAKHLLQCKLVNASLTYEELCTITAEVEAILNSRPLTAMSDDPNDLSVLTPGHFLIGDSLKATVDNKAEPIRGALPTRWKLVSHIKAEFWNRWSREYLNELQNRTKWKKQSNNIKIGTIVIMKEDNVPVMKWPLGKIENIHIGKDGLVRVADVRTKSGVLRRPIHKLAPLVENDDSDSLASERKRRNDDPDPDEPTSSKSSRRSINPNLLTTMLLIALLLPAIVATNIEVIKFNNSSPGIHFQRHGTVSLVHNKWNIVVLYDLEPYKREFQLLKNTTTILNHICQKLSSKELCIQITQQFQVIQNELLEDNFITPNRFSTRMKRGAIDIVGNIANSLFGVLDSKYDERISKTIEGLQTNEEHLLNLLKNHTSILDSTINVVKSSHEDMMKRQRTLDNQFAQITNSISNVTEELYQTKMKELFLSWCTQATLVIINLQRMQTALIDVLTDSHRGHVNHLLITYQQLKTEVAKIRNHLPPGLRIAVEPNQMIQLYKLMNVKGQISSNYIIFTLELPLLSVEEYTIYKLFSIPITINETFVTIQPSADMLAVSAHHDEYYPITKDELSKCSEMNDDHYLCEQTHPVYQSGTRLNMCEINLLNNNSDLSTCELKVLKSDSVWTKLPHLNQWIFAVRKQTMLNIVCNKQTTFVNIQGNGLLRLPPSCVAKGEKLTLQGQQILSSRIEASYTRIMNGVQFEDVIRLASPQYNVTKLRSFDFELNNLRDQLTIQQLELPRQIRSSTIQHTIISSIGIVIASTVLLCLIWKYCVSVYTKRSSPSDPMSGAQSLHAIHQLSPPRPRMSF